MVYLKNLVSKLQMIYCRLPKEPDRQIDKTLLNNFCNYYTFKNYIEMNHRRDFLRENKLSLRDLQKTTNEKLAQQNQDLENRQYKHLQKYRKTQQQSVELRSNSRNRNIHENCKQQPRITAIADAGGGVDNRGGGFEPTVKNKTNYLLGRRSYSQQRSRVENLQPSPTVCCCNSQHQKFQHSRNQNQYGQLVPPRSASSASVLSKADSCDKEIQTEDINDQEFLQEALRKCSFSDVYLQKQKSTDKLNSKEIQQYEPELNSINCRERIAHFNLNRNEDNNSAHNQMLQQTTQNLTKLNGYNHKLEDDGEHVDLGHFQNVKTCPDMITNPEPQLSARSRHSLCSTSTKRSIHKLGSREDICLPRYLEKEKRELEEERLRELSNDRNCPPNHYGLSEDERLKALNKAQQKMASLINELNHMPMTMQTLRIRNRKVEIEKELTQIEFDIRLYSKPKVYIPKPANQY